MSKNKHLKTPLFKLFSLDILEMNGDILLSENLIIELINSFWDIIFNLYKDKVILAQVQLRTDTNYKSLSKQITVSFSEKEVFTNLVLGRFRDVQSRYKDFPIEGLYLRYLVLGPDAPKANLKALELQLRSVKYEPLTIYNLPATLDLSTWGFLLINTPVSALIRRGEHSLISISINDNVRSVSVLEKDVVSYSFTDTIISLELDHFTRLFVDGTLVTYKSGLQTSLQKPQKPTLFMERLEKDSEHSFFAGTLDLETITDPITQELEVISACRFTESKWGDGWYKTYFINDYENGHDLILALIMDLFSPPFCLDRSGMVFYVHNFSSFDSVFILQILAEYTEKFKIIKKDDKVISLKVSKSVFSKNDTTITFLDSQSLLPIKLAKLAPAFGVGLKGNLDFAKVNSCTTYQDFEAIRYELLEYNKQDCFILYRVLERFSELVFNLFSVDLKDTPTLGSLALKIYRSNFMPEDARISITDAELYQKLKPGYMGGAVDVYKPENPEGKPVYCYDVNSLYPAVMINDMPVGAPTFVEGDLDLTDPATFGFIRVKVKAPDNLYIPILQTKVNGSSMAPVGTWTGWYFSEELKYALNLGYTFEVYEGVLFERGRIFFDYVSALYKLRSTYSKEDPRNLICKLLLNNLYGKFGMNPELSIWTLYDNNIEGVIKALSPTKGRPASKHTIGTALDSLELGSKLLVGQPQTFNKNVKVGLSEVRAMEVLANQLEISVTELQNRLSSDKALRTKLNRLTSNHKHLNISLPISMAVTAYGRMKIHEFKLLAGQENLLYSDTDSLFTTNPLPDSEISAELGYMKLVFIANRAVMLAPKMYAIDKYIQGGERVEPVKIKGLKEGHGVTYSDLKDLVYKDCDPKLVQQNKLIKKLSMATILSKDLDIQITLTENKREILWKEGKFVGTRPYVINGDKIVN